MRYITAAGLVALAGLGFSDARADGNITSLSGGQVTLLKPDVLGTGKYEVIVTSGTDVSFTLRFDAGDVVEEVKITPLNQSGAKVRATVDGIPSQIPPAFYGLQQVKNVVRGSGAGEVWITLVQANVIGDILEANRDPGEFPNYNSNYGETTGLIKTNRIGTVRAHWSIFADIEATGTALSNPDGDIIDFVWAELNLNWDPPYALDGSILGSIYSNGGDIGEIRAKNFISAVNNESSDNTQVIDTSGGDIELIDAGQLGVLTIDCSGPNYGSVDEIVTRTGGWGYDYGVGGDLNDPYVPAEGARGFDVGFSEGGELHAKGLGTLTLRGSLDSEIRLYSDPQSGIWRIADSFGPNGEIWLPPGGLTGQIAFGADGLGVDESEEQTDRWVNGAELYVERPPQELAQPYLITGPMYTQTPSNLGGGAAALQPYDRHNSACNPKANSSVLIGSIDPQSFEEDPPCINDFPVIRVGFYGQVDPVGSLSLGDAILLHRRPDTSSGWGDPLSAQVTSTNGRIVEFRRPMNASWDPGQYRVTILEDSLEVRANNVLDNGPRLLVPDEVYVFWLVAGCPGLFDLNGDGGLNAADMVEWYSNPVNLNNQPEVDGNDLLTLIRGINEHGD